MSTQAQTILNTCWNSFLFDAAQTRWPASEMIGHLNDIILEIVKADDTAFPVRKPVQLVPGTVFQTGLLPNDGTLVKHLSVTRNLIPNASAPGGYLPGRAITKVASIEIMDKQRRGWYSTRPDTVVQNWIPGGEDYQNFFAYPPPPLNVPVWVELLYSAVPPQLVALTDTIPIFDKYRYQMQLGVVGRALMKDISAADQVRGKAFLDLFYATLTPR